MATMSSDRERLLEYRRRVQARYAPVVTVVTTPAVDASCAASGLTFADLLRPFCELRGLDVPMRHNPEAPLHPHGVRDPGPQPGGVSPARRGRRRRPHDPVGRALGILGRGVPRAHPRRDPPGRPEPRRPPRATAAPRRRRRRRPPRSARRTRLVLHTRLNRYAARLDRTLMFAEHESVDHPRG